MPGVGRREDAAVGSGDRAGGGGRETRGGQRDDRDDDGNPGKAHLFVIGIRGRYG
jgi:hypothetical protein